MFFLEALEFASQIYQMTNAGGKVHRTPACLTGKPGPENVGALAEATKQGGKTVG